ncbi:hypothetical protein [Brucella rhizosphaerae]|uniref:HEPN domain-containing protein n=1 Tax=Brucella rhizosphaerae TaxID=571254 RepID=A0A256F5K8_9HYPH|nr:hypothetical protein [Brucella rhizosphaerae]OYR10118.1 hypothetical protein CEV32_2555 [Brucella rhizosphaerae]
MKYDEIINQENFDLPLSFKRFLSINNQHNRFGQSWGNYVHAYHRAFEVMARHMLENPIRNQCVTIPLFYLARHSMELALKETLLGFSDSGIQAVKAEGHNLLTLYDELLKVLKDNGVSDEQWSIHCHKIIVHLNKADPNGENFRYPEALNRKVFPEVEVDIEGLIRAHHHVTLLSDCVATMLDEQRFHESF